MATEAASPPETKENIANTVLDLIGNTPLVRLNVLTKDSVAEVVAKLESRNPSNSVKDRIAYSMIQAAEERGEISPDRTTLVEITSGNTGIGLALVAAIKGYKLIIVMPEYYSLERRVVIKAFGAQVIVTPAAKAVPGAVAKGAEILKKLGPNGWLVDQFGNPANPDIHRDTTGPEIWRDTGGKVDIVVSGIGTGGTLTGVARYLKPLNPDIKFIAVEPTESAVLSGGEPGPHLVQGMGAGFIPVNADTSLFDEVITVSSQEAVETARRLALEEGIFAGISSGAIVTAALRVSKRPENAGKRIVTFIPSFGERYLSTALFKNLFDEAVNQKAEDVEDAEAPPQEEEIAQPEEEQTPPEEK